MRGGYRKNAGRKIGFPAKNAEEARRLLSEMVAREIIPIGEILIAKAKKGDISAIKELFDRAWGKAPQAMDIKMENKEYSETLTESYLDELARRLGDELIKEKTFS
jgi:hypothetical protein